MNITKVVPWTVIKASEGDAKSIYEHLKRSFFLDEPLTNKASKPLELDGMFALKALPQNHSFRAVDMDGNTVGVAINYDNDNEPECPDPSDNDIFFKELFRMLDLAEKSTGKTRPGVLALHLLSVDKSYRRQGMAKKLVEATEEHARNNGFNGIKIECTSKHTADLVKSRGYERIYNLAYKDFLNDKGEPSFTPPFPHTEFQVFIKNL